MIKCLITSDMQDEQLRVSSSQREMLLDVLLEKVEKKEDAKMMSTVMQNEDHVKKINKHFPRGNAVNVSTLRCDIQPIVAKWEETFNVLLKWYLSFLRP